MPRITINGVSLEPTRDAPQLLAKSLLSKDSSQSNYVLIQTDGPLDKNGKKQLADAGVVLLEYVPEDTYIARYAPSDLDAIRALSVVKWANAYMPGFKIAPELHVGGAGQANLLALGDIVGGPSRDLQLVDIVLHRKADASSVAEKVANAAGIDVTHLTPSNGKFRVRVSTARLPAIAAIDEVRSVEPVREKKLFNNVAVKILAADVVHQHASYEGEGETIAVCDTGLDLGSVQNMHPAFGNRVVKVYALGRSTGSDPQGHGTHVCGSAVGDGQSASLGQVRGTAPRAKLVMQSVLDASGGLGGLPANLGDLFTAPYDDDGARVHSNSWGDSRNAYTQEAHEVDDFVWKHRDAVILFAAGNDGADGNGNGVVDAGSLGSPGTAKNCITVGASENDRPDFKYTADGASIATYGQGWPRQYPVEPLASDRLADNPEGLAAFSSRGPTRDGRIKPDVVAPGTAILSTRSRSKGVGEGWGLSSDPLYFFEGGTSMATPLVAGCAAVVRQSIKKTGQTPSAALVKALLINGAHDEAGQHVGETGGVPNNHEGFGRVNLAASVVPPPQGTLLHYWDERTALDTGEEEIFGFALSKRATLLKVTLVWTDAPGETLQNDLDLVVKSTRGTERHGNRGSSKGFDRTNNVEQVVMHAVGAGKVEISVRAYRAAIAPQSFALVARAVF